MAKTTVKFEGLADLERRLNMLSVDVAKKIARQATAAGANVIKKAAALRVPVRTGALKKSIVIKRIPENQTDLAAEYDVGVSTRQMRKYKKDSRRALREQAGPMPAQYGSKGQLLKPGRLYTRAESYEDFGDLFYFRFIEFGTVKMAAKPFLRPAFDSQKGAAVEKMAEILRKRIERAEAGK